MSRLGPIDPENITPAQKQAHDAIAAGPRGSVRGPFAALLHNPGVADAVQRMGASLRFDGTLPDNLREIAILTTGRFWTAQYEWWAHARIAIENGLPEAVIDAIKRGVTPPETEPGINAVTLFVRETLHKKHVSDDTFNAALEYLGERGIVDLTMLIGYYCLVSASLNIFQIPLPNGAKVPFDD